VRRDNGLVREILIDISKGINVIDNVDDSENGILYDYHLKILNDAGIIKILRKENALGDPIYSVAKKPELTYRGNDFLDAALEDGVWNQAKNTLKEKGLSIASIPMDTLIEILKNTIKEKMGLA